ncbi:aldehyde dehydrogenase [Vitreoscilla massiliensis]|uniref:Aldehyde dehydrogenase n=1 Tax=Vitreoscilla massiliensis TaxID=1689272 RepID=A0ABY4E6W3_9NEIS|nr:aldehyde dehydrogenase [Vitreoscilla massiliensis]UOO90615.1 aldehyde dehydrogenase [Vitreoscilla massiliensis]
MEKNWQELRARLTLPTQAFVNGVYEKNHQDGVFDVINPATDETLAQVHNAGEACVNRAVAAAKSAFQNRVWAGLSIDERKAVLCRLADLILAHGDELALLDSISMGKPVNEALNIDVAGSAYILRWYAEALDKMFDQVAPTPSNALATITREAIGVVAAVVPWNYPLEMAIWKLAPALAVGNSVVLKPAEQSPFSALRLAELAIEAGMPAGVFNVVTGTGELTGRLLGLHMDVDCLTFTGSTAVGKMFMSYSAQSNLKQVWLECGGKSPNIVFQNCKHLEHAAQKSLAGIFFNQGEVCSANSRLYVERPIYAEFLALLEQHAATWQPSQPLQADAKAGALISRSHALWIEEQVAAAVARGATVLTGGKVFSIDGKGTFFQPTILINTTVDDDVNQQELFGPVVSVLPFDSEDEVINWANDSVYGLAASIWTDDIHQAHRVAKRLQAGTVSVNTVDALGVTTPFGGYKQSGFGKDLSLFAFDKFVNLKTTWFQIL